NLVRRSLRFTDDLSFSDASTVSGAVCLLRPSPIDLDPVRCSRLAVRRETTSLPSSTQGHGPASVTRSRRPRRSTDVSDCPETSFSPARGALAGGAGAPGGDPSVVKVLSGP